jgi:hypothetical protein
VSDTQLTDVTPPQPGPLMAHTSDSWCAYPWRDGIQVPSLAPLDRLAVRTCNSVYEVIVRDPWRAEVMVRGGQFFPDFTRAWLDGSSLGGSFLKQHGVYVGFRLEVRTEDQVIVTSPVREISRLVDDSPM